MFLHGFSWLSFGNDDMGNYCASALRLLNHPNNGIPSEEAIERGIDFTLVYWYMQGASSVRLGADLLVALSSAVTGVHPTNAFMATILAQHLALLAASAGLIEFTSRNRKAAIGTFVLLAVSAPVSYVLLQQLIAQVGGMALLATTLVLACHRNDRLGLALRLRRALLLGVVLAGFLIHYPEMMPFFGITYLGVLVHRLWWRKPTVRLVVQMALAGLLLVALTRDYFEGSFVFLASQSAHGANSRQDVAAQQMREMFPYFVEISGFARLWGFQSPISSHYGAYTYLATMLGILLTGITTVWVMVLSWRGNVLAMAGLVMGAVGLMLASREASFGIFKLAMFAQPMMLGVVSLVGLGAMRGKLMPRLACLAMLTLVPCNFLAQQRLTASSISRFGASGLPEGSTGKAVAEIRALVREKQPKMIFVDANSETLVRWSGPEVIGIPTDYLSLELFERIGPIGDIRSRLRDPLAIAALNAREARIRRRRDGIDLFEADGNRYNEVAIHRPMDLLQPPPGSYLLGSTGRISVINRTQYPETSPTSVFMKPLEEVRNHLVFVDSKLSHQIIMKEGFNGVGLHQMEGDPAFPGRSFAAVGRYLTLLIINPDPKVRVLLDITSSHRPMTGPRPLEVWLIGEKKTLFRRAGMASSRMVSEPVAPQMIGGVAYLMVDFGENPKSARLGNPDLTRIDPRYFLAHLRNLSIVTEAEYAALKPPTSIANFPADLGDPNLLHSGICEDGWVSEEMFVDLTMAEANGALVFDGLLPAIQKDDAFQSEIKIFVDDQLVDQSQLYPSEIKRRIPLSLSAGRHRVRMTFSACRSLSPHDPRKLSIHLNKLAFENETRLVDERR